jgi:hypothetical protein
MVMITIFFTGNRFLRLVYLPQRQKCNKEYFISEVLEGMNQECNQGARSKVTKMMKIHMENRRVQNAPETWQEMPRMKIEKRAHPLYSPDPNPCDFWFFWTGQESAGRGIHKPLGQRHFRGAPDRVPEVD